MTNQSCN